MPQISIIVPVYNVEKYFEKCITSILKQTFTDLEVILVDDGSTDESGKLCDKFAEQDDRVIVIHKENGGLSSARNAGIDIARGEYLAFVDSDDYIHPEMISILYHNIIMADADIAVCDVREGSLQNGFDNYKLPKQKISCMSNIKAMNMAFSGKGIFTYAVNKLYKKWLFSGVSFPIGKTYEDVYIFPDIFLKASTVVSSNLKLYYYFQRQESITNCVFQPQHLNYIRSYKRVLQCIPEELRNTKWLVYCRIVYTYMFVYDKLVVSELQNLEKYQEVAKFIRKNIAAVLCGKVFILRRKLQALALLFSPQLCAKLTRYAFLRHGNTAIGGNY